MTKALDKLLRGEAPPIEGMRLRVRRSQMGQNPQPIYNNSPLEGEENPAFKTLTQRMRRNMTEKNPTLSPASQDEQMKEWQDALGQKGLLNYFVEEPLIMGVPYNDFAINAFAQMALFVCTQQFIYLFFAAPIVHLLLFINYTTKARRLREENIERLLTQGMAA